MNPMTEAPVFGTFTDYETARSVYDMTTEKPLAVRLAYYTVGLAGEAGEVANKVAKIIRDDDGIVSVDKALEIAKELGDVLWFVSALAAHIGFSLLDIACMNIGKLASRKARGTLAGSGDNR